jgi:hypothetical protein
MNYFSMNIFTRRFRQFLSFALFASILFMKCRAQLATNRSLCQRKTNGGLEKLKKSFLHGQIEN